MKNLKDYENKKKEKLRTIKEIKFSGIGKAQDFKKPLEIIQDLVEIIKPIRI